MPEEKKNRDVRDATFGHTKDPEVKRDEHSNRGAAHAHAEEMHAKHEEDAPIELPSPGIVMDPKVEDLLASGKRVEVGGDNILREVKTDDE
jgi:hypothetical protein